MAMTREQITARLAQAFNEWMRRYTDEPEKFRQQWRDIKEFLAENAAGQEPSYGQSCAEYFTSILDGIPFPDGALELSERVAVPRIGRRDPEKAS